MKNKGKQLITEIARETGRQLTAFEALEAAAAQTLASATEDYAQFRITGAAIEGAIHKDGKVRVFKIEG